MKHFINLKDISAKDLRKILIDAKKRKRARKKLNNLEVDKGKPLKGKLLIQMFEKSSLRTRLSFYLAIKQLGGSTLTRRPDELHLSKGGESIADTAKILSNFGNAFMLRTDSDKKLEEFKKYLSIPIINGLSPSSHPTQILSDVFTVEEIKAQEIEKITVSSTKIRNSINQGDIKTTEKYLGRYFNLTGKVVKGDGLGKKINYPTANIFIEETYKIIPKDGVYLVETKIKDKLFNGMMNIGHRPTIGTNVKSIEVHLFNFNKDIYNQVISIKMISKIRDEIKFSSIQALKDQLVKDENYCLKLINK